ncbi:MAG: hypothetical protein WCW77_01030 [Patescibacteria group bacterium]
MPKKIILVISIAILLSIPLIYFSNTRNRIEIKGVSGFVKVYNFFPFSDNKLDKNTYFIKQNQDFTLSYFNPDSLFLITLENKDVRSARTKAENELLRSLKISRSAACKLNVDLEVPDYVDSGLSGVNYYLSFCPNGIPFSNTTTNSDTFAQKAINTLKNPLTAALIAAVLIIGGIILFARR